MMSILKSRIRILLLLLLLLPSTLSARQIHTFYGPIDLEEPVLLELIDSPFFQRLRAVHQYGVAYYTTHREEYSRYDHSIGVLTILKARGAPLVEQIAGLLHDVSHTAFSHVGDWVVGIENQEECFQDNIYEVFIQNCELVNILQKYGYTVEQILPDLFPALESPLPELCADRIDYNIQGAYHQGFISYDEAIAIFKNLKFIENRWVSTEPELMKKLARFALYMTESCWGSPTNHVMSRWLANAITRCISLGGFTPAEFYLGTDQAIWDMLMSQTDKEIRRTMHKVKHPYSYFSFVRESEADIIVKSKFRGIDPWILLDGQYIRLTEYDRSLAKDFQSTKKKVTTGWSLKIL